ncbi:hypothetical protein CAQUA_08290 [Corynebacterium aquatimens]|uniref:Uncharacterized protein n=1 Tax=Corynebacterium aquatimens TaxID=1190508 RepID=A0A931E0F3_9CORY|nr:hypothetical protein [Corynebacterium aquatimens]WJY66352.1 hypothetical protein CAQUA_08290 [Corynebacterium aquatimens]
MMSQPRGASATDYVRSYPSPFGELDDEPNPGTLRLSSILSLILSLILLKYQCKYLGIYQCGAETMEGI